MMHKILVVALISVTTLTNAQTPPQDETSQPIDGSAELSIDYQNVIQPFFENHCVKCHGPEKTKSDMRIDTLMPEITDESAAEHWQEVLDTLNAAEMPPEKESQPSAQEMADVIEVMTDRLFEARKRLVDSRTITIRRLNKREYANTIKDLLGVPVDTLELPTDGEVEGFDTVGDGHFMSAAVFEKYLKLGRKALEQWQSVNRNISLIASVKLHTIEN